MARSEMGLFQKGDVVRGLGRNGRPWPSRPVGVVSGRTRLGVLVRWCGTFVEDEMRSEELEAVGSRAFCSKMR